MLASLLPELTDRAEPLNEPLTRAIHAISAMIPHAVTGWNGKVERFHQTMEREGAKGVRHRTARRATAHCHTGCAATTSAGATADVATDPRSARLVEHFNRFWPKKTLPDFHLLTRREMRRLFPDAEIICERSFGLVKSLTAVRT